MTLNEILGIAIIVVSVFGVSFILALLVYNHAYWKGVERGLSYAYKELADEAAEADD